MTIRKRVKYEERCRAIGDTVMDESDSLMLAIGTKTDLGSMAHFVCMVTWIE